MVELEKSVESAVIPISAKVAAPLPWSVLEQFAFLIVKDYGV